MANHSLQDDTEARLQELNIHAEEMVTKNSNFNWSEAVECVRSGQLSALNFAEERPYEKNDFVSHYGRSFKSLQFALEIVIDADKKESSVLKSDKDVLKHVTVSILLLCGENVQSKEWNQPRHIEISYKILSHLKSIFTCDSVSNIFLYQLQQKSESISQDGEILRWAIQDLSPKLDKTSWRNFPAAQFCFSWILHQLSFPDLGRHIPEFLPFSLRFVDDWEIKNKVMGLTCLDHIVSESNPTELKWYGRAELITDALHKLLFYREEEVVKILFPCWFRLLRKTEKGDDSHGRINGWDKLAKELLYKMETESNIDLKRAYGKQLQPLLEGLEMRSVRWMTSVLHAISNYLEYPDVLNEECRIDSLYSLLVLLRLGDQRVKRHAKTIFEMLIRLLYETSKKVVAGDKNDNQVMLFNLCSQCLKLGAKLAPDEFKLLCDGMDQVNVNDNFNNVIKDLFTEAFKEDTTKKELEKDS